MIPSTVKETRLSPAGLTFPSSTDFSFEHQCSTNEPDLVAQIENPHTCRTEREGGGPQGQGQHGLYSKILSRTNEQIIPKWKICKSQRT